MLRTFVRSVSLVAILAGTAAAAADPPAPASGNVETRKTTKKKTSKKLKKKAARKSHKKAKAKSKRTKSAVPAPASTERRANP